MIFTVSCCMTVVGWIEVEADNLEDAKKKCLKINDVGFPYEDINDPEYESELFLDEIEEM